MTNVEVVHVRTAHAGDIDALAPLFDAYRVFYHQASDPPAAQRFVSERIAQGQATICAAVHRQTERIAGFITLHPMVSLVRLGPQLILEDLFVAPEMRGMGIATALLRHAQTFAHGCGAVGVVLSTHHTNVTAQRLYERCGYVRDQEFYHYALATEAIEAI